MAPSILWFRRDLRLDDHQPLQECCRLGAVLPLFVLDPALLQHPETGSGRVAFLLEALAALDQDLRRRGGRLLVRRGDPMEVLPALASACGVRRVFAHSDSERILGRVRDARVDRALRRRGVAMHWFEPAGACAELVPYPHWRHLWQAAMAGEAAAAPRRVWVPPPLGGANDPLADQPLPGLRELGLNPTQIVLPPAGHGAALDLLQRFVAGPAAERYFWQLSQPAARVTTGLSPYLKFGVISPRRCLQGIAPLAHGDGGQRRSWLQLASRLRWGCGMAQRFRYLPQLELRSLWACHEDPQAEDLSAHQQELLAAWQEGRTGFPIVDAAARCLRASGGWQELNFRSRAISASFLTHLCGIDWRWGALHYMRHLLDGDCTIDHYQWAMQAGATLPGAEAWARIYHPGRVAQQRCDPQGLFIRRWLPELAGLTNDQLAEPPAMADYPAPVLDYHDARRHRLTALEERRARERERLATADPADADALLRLQLADLSTLPARPIPFAAHLFPEAPLAWCEAEQELRPAAIDPARLDGPQRLALASWISPASGPRGGSQRGSRGKRGKNGNNRINGDATQQLELWPQA